MCDVFRDVYMCIYIYVDIYRYNVYNERERDIYISIVSVDTLDSSPPSCGFDSSPPPVVFDSSPLSCGLSVEIRTAHASFPRLLQVTAQQFTSNADVNTWWPGETFFFRIHLLCWTLSVLGWQFLHLAGYTSAVQHQLQNTVLILRVPSFRMGECFFEPPHATVCADHL